MKQILTLMKAGLVGCCTLFVLAGTANAYSYATDIAYSAGTGVTDSYRKNPNNALGAEDATSDGDKGFFSLGLGGKAVFDFGTSFAGSAAVFETTWNSRSNYRETATVYVADQSFDFSAAKAADYDGWSNIESLFLEVGEIVNSQAESIIDLSALVGSFRYLLIVDTSGYPSADGFDIDAVGVAPVPEPATIVLLGSGLAGLAWFSRKRKNM